jgi:hypothetical protein
LQRAQQQCAIIGKCPANFLVSFKWKLIFYTG